MRRLPSLLLVAGLLASSCTRPAEKAQEAPEAPAAAAPTTREIVARALPAVVLLVRTLEDGTRTYGAGFIVSEDGLVLTNLHVVKDARSLHTLLYAEGRTSYTPMDGGLARFLFENDRDLVPAHLVRADPSVDLAVVRVDADTRGRATLVFGDAPLRVGDPVLALGHPGETVWSFTSGVVSALHHGAIQHDAAVNQGSSGGPLLDAHGRVVGINTSKLLHGVEGVAFSRPIQLAGRVLEGARAAPLIDFSAPETGAVGCIRGQELADPAIVDCFAWDYRWRAWVEAVRLVEAELAPSGADKARLAALRATSARASWIATQRANTLAWFQGKVKAGDKDDVRRLDPAPIPRLEHVDPERLARAAKDAAARVARGWKAQLGRIERENGIKMSLRDAAEVQGLLKMGLRADDTHPLDDGRVWVRLEGRNLDGTPYAFSELWVRAKDHWRQAWPPPPALQETLPEGWPRPLDDFDTFVQRHRAAILKALLERRTADAKGDHAEAETPPAGGAPG